MKTSFFITTFCIVSLSVFVVWNRLKIHHGVSITVNENSDRYSFSAYYENADTRAVEHYINKSISPNSLAGSDHDYFDANTILRDGTRFHIIESPGTLKIDIDKRGNSPASFYRIKKICDGVKSLLAGK